MRTSDIDHACQMYGLALTGRERGLLTAPQPELLLSAVDQQERYVLARSLEPSRCPACGYITCRRAAVREQDAADRSEVPDDGYLCRNCGADLTWNLGMRGEQWFTLTLPGRSDKG